MIAAEALRKASPHAVPRANGPRDQLRKHRWQDVSPVLVVMRGGQWLKQRRDFRIGETYTTPLLPGFELLIQPA